jgi:hypothetical protein
MKSVFFLLSAAVAMEVLDIFGICKLSIFLWNGFVRSSEISPSCTYNTRPEPEIYLQGSLIKKYQESMDGYTCNTHSTSTACRLTQRSSRNDLVHDETLGYGYRWVICASLWRDTEAVQCWDRSVCHGDTWYGMSMATHGVVLSLWEDEALRLWCDLGLSSNYMLKHTHRVWDSHRNDVSFAQKWLRDVPWV